MLVVVVVGWRVAAVGEAAPATAAAAVVLVFAIASAVLPVSLARGAVVLPISAFPVPLASAVAQAAAVA